jgi:hypothetical protein
MLEQLVTETLETLNESARETYINALKQSLRIDVNFTPAPGTFPKIATPQDIARDGLSFDKQYKLRVSTLKPVALEFLIHDAHIPDADWQQNSIGRITKNASDDNRISFTKNH